MTPRTITIGTEERIVDVDGTDGAPGVLILLGPEAESPAPDADALTGRLVASGLQTFVWRWGADAAAPSHDDVAEGLDGLGLHWVNLVGVGAGAAPAWQTAARHFGRVSSLVVLDDGHPAAGGPDGAPADPGCPAVDVATTVVVWSDTHRGRAYATGRHVYSDYRVVEPPASAQGPAGAAVAAALATEVILRSNPW